MSELVVMEKKMIAEVTSSAKAKEEFRIYDGSNSRVERHYEDMRKYQTIDFYRRMEHKYSFENGQHRSLMTMEEAFDRLDAYVDASDPDFELPNRLHLLQTAEAIRKAGHPDWFQLVGLLHDVGKIMFLWGTAEDGQDATSKRSDGHYQQWALGGDTFVVGCRIPYDAVVFPQFNCLNPDMNNPLYNTECGIYEPQCGLSQLCFAWGHDEYMYRMLVANQTTIPPEGLDMIRYHSAYPVHDKNAYRHLLQQPLDDQRLEWVRLLNQFDLYTKDKDTDSISVEELWPYYKTLLEKYGLGGTLKW
mmetsp:Transcript_19108/g.24587  ORF Transcript_19108/g.24587 Transcript_19108/m.24587 type:complete len:303 (+) Transcript_19108:188-1096(+)|eukprot:CAMPEP_0198143714 /NCGR_PEP_ID=MMETSP1443-20131203/9750_1 /TAXON_ID=186043 /ORGANISM="Entomoneis sp., Strain CCMP2396" /LENGTH=302 /DNA_ID=CAMNT_0043806991 /DNA_START=109 /DNA_END=1017 /DNA_ORIENTATION=+